MILIAKLLNISATMVTSTAGRFNAFSMLMYTKLVIFCVISWGEK